MSCPTASFPLLKLKIKETADKPSPSIIFWGTPEFAAIILKELINTPFKPKAAVTAPDKPVGRKRILTPSPVKELALANKISVFQPGQLKENQNFKLQIASLNPDLFIVTAYGLILPKEILNIPKFDSLNIHPSLLPKYRGASPIQAAILNGDQETGATIILMDEKIDHGPILAQREWEVRNPKFEILNKELAELGAKLLIETLPRWLNGETKPIPQDHSKATFTKIIKKEDGRVDWTKSAEEIERMARAYWPWPSAYTYLKSKILKIIKADVLKLDQQKIPGAVFLTEDKQLAVACGQNALILDEIQLGGKRKISGKDFLNGYPWIIGSVLS